MQAKYRRVSCQVDGAKTRARAVDHLAGSGRGDGQKIHLGFAQGRRTLRWHQPIKGIIMGLLDILGKYAGSAEPHPDTAAHYDEVAGQAPGRQPGFGTVVDVRSNATPPFGQTVGTIFGQSNPEQRAGILNQIIQTMGPAALAAGGGILSKIMASAGTSAPAAAAPRRRPYRPSRRSRPRRCRPRT